MRAWVLAAVVAFAAGCGGSGPPIKVEATKLFEAYDKDVVAADKQYTGRTVELADVGGKVEKDADGRYYLAAAESARFVKTKDEAPRMMSSAESWRRIQQAALNTTYMPGVMLYLDAKEAEKFSGLGGTKVTVRGRCKGMTKDEKTQPGYFVTVEGVGLVK